MARKKIIAGNWKMNMTPSEAVELVNTLKPLVSNDEVDVVFCVPAIDIVPVVEAVKGDVYKRQPEYIEITRFDSGTVLSTPDLPTEKSGTLPPWKAGA